MSTTFHVRINGEPSFEHIAHHGLYAVAAAEAWAIKGGKDSDMVEIWCDSVMPYYGPYTYLISTTSGPELSVVSVYEEEEGEA